MGSEDVFLHRNNMTDHNSPSMTLGSECSTLLRGIHNIGSASDTARRRATSKTERSSSCAVPQQNTRSDAYVPLSIRANEG